MLVDVKGSHLVLQNGGGRVGAWRVCSGVHAVETHLAYERDCPLKLLLCLSCVYSTRACQRFTHIDWRALKGAQQLTMQPVLEYTVVATWVAHDCVATDGGIWHVPPDVVDDVAITLVRVASPIQLVS